MRSPIHLLLIMIVLGFLYTGCSHQKNVVSGNLVQKRKYRSGFHTEAFTLFRSRQATEPSPVCSGWERQIKSGTGAENPEVQEGSRLTKTETDAMPALEEMDKDQPRGIFTFPVRRGAGATKALEPPPPAKHRPQPVTNSDLFPQPETGSSGDEDPYERAGTLSVTFGLLNFLLLWLVPFVGVAMAVLAIYFGIKSLNSTDSSTKALGIVGMILGFISLFMALIWTMAVIAILFFGL